MATIDNLTGGCLCGAVRFTAYRVETTIHACHCGMCRRWGGGPFLGVDAARVDLDGEDHLRSFESSEWARRGFCGECGSSLFYYLEPDDRYSLSAGAFDDQSRFQLAQEIFIDQKPPGYAFAGDRPRMTEAEVLAKFGGGA